MNTLYKAFLAIGLVLVVTSWSHTIYVWTHCDGTVVKGLYRVYCVEGELK